MHKVLVNRLGGLSLPRKSVVRLTDSPDMTLDVYRGCKTTMQQQQQQQIFLRTCGFFETKFHMKDGSRRMKSNTNELGRLTNMASILLFLVKILKNSSPEPVDPWL